MRADSGSKILAARVRAGFASSARYISSFLDMPFPFSVDSDSLLEYAGSRSLSGRVCHTRRPSRSTADLYTTEGRNECMEEECASACVARLERVRRRRGRAAGL